MHNGKAARGVAASQYKTGRYSKYLPARMLPRYLESQDDPELLNLRWEVALIDSRIADLLTRVDSGEAGNMWAQLDTIRRHFEEAQLKGNRVRSAAAVKEVMSLIAQGAADFAAWDQITDLIERRRRLVESERKRLVEMHQVVKLDNAMTLIHQLSQSVRGHVVANCEGRTARVILAGVQADITRAIGADTT
jgi:hypothetical protein